MTYRVIQRQIENSNLKRYVLQKRVPKKILGIIPTKKYDWIPVEITEKFIVAEEWKRKYNV